MNLNDKIPEQVATAILANRQYFHELNAKAKATNPNSGFVTKPLKLQEELQFWSISDDESLEEFLNYDLLAALYGKETIDWSTMPAGYEPVLLVLEFERHCAFEGWTAVSNKGEEEMGKIIAAYNTLGIAGEASAPEAVTAAYVALDDDDHSEFHDILGEAYRSVENSTSEEDDRAPIVWEFIRQNPTLFSVNS
jgi:hypothetical protein